MSEQDVEAVCLGESMALVAPDPPEPLCRGVALRLDVAGAESNTAIWLASLGVRAAWRGRIGADPFGDMIEDSLVDAGVDFEAEVDPRAPTGLYVKDPYGRAVHYYRRGSAASFMGRDMLTGLSGARVLHLSGITAALSDSCADLMRHALVDRPHPAVVSFDVNYRAGLWSAADAAPVLAELANAADLVFVGRDEAEVLWGTVIADKIRAVLSQPRTLIVKDGGVGATAYVADHARVFAPAPPVDIVEPVGAGDAFAAGYLYGLLRDAPMAARLRLGHLVAGCAMRSAGDVGTPPSPAEISQALNSDD